MAANFNRVIVAGNVTRDLELRHIPSGSAVVDIGLAVNSKVKRGDQWEEVVDFFDCSLFGRTAEVAAQYLAKGSSVLIEGRLRQESWNDKNTGEKRYKIKIIGDTMQMLSSKGDKSAPAKPDQYQQPVSAPSGGGEGGSMEDVPFAPHLI